MIKGVVYPAMQHLWSHWAPPLESTRLLSVTYSGSSVGTFTAMAVSGVVVRHLGWRWIFYIFGIGIGIFRVFGVDCNMQFPQVPLVSSGAASGSLWSASPLHRTATSPTQSSATSAPPLKANRKPKYPPPFPPPCGCDLIDFCFSF